ncbi:MAG: hypothetical protein LBS74_06735 [Oscillospiraceae bacterium]|jgi:hypothetical protein|nr:hypothetical protein [Oscillospiraceae bacterium]
MSKSKKAGGIVFVSVFALFSLLCILYVFGVLFPAHKQEVQSYTLGEYGDSYTGTMLSGNFTGQGSIAFSNGDSYSGGFKNNYFNGEGQFKSFEGWSFKGEFAMGEIIKGVFTEANGGTYSFEKDKTPQYKSAEKWEYSGESNERGQQGSGVFIYADGSRYEGGFEKGVASGQGEYRDAEGWVYTGEFKEGYFHGKGTIRYANGDVINGNWEKGKLKSS